MTYQEWIANMTGVGADLGVPTSPDGRNLLGGTQMMLTDWPPQFADGHAGEPCVRFDNATYVQAYNAGFLPPGEGTHPDRTGQYVYVLARAITGSDEVVKTSPHRMTPAEKLANDLFNKGDKLADKLGLPSLDTLGNVGKVVAAVGGLLAVSLVVSAFRKR